MGIWNQLMYIVMMLFALTSNFSIAATSICIVLGALVMVTQKMVTGSLPDMDKGLVKAVGLFCVLQLIAAAMSANPNDRLGEMWGVIYRFSPLFMGIGYLQTRRRLAWILVAFAVSVLVADVVGAYQLVALGDDSPNGTSNASSFYVSHLLMAMPIFYLMCRQDEVVFSKRTIPAFMLLFSLMMYLASGSVDGWGVFAVVMIVLILLETQYRKQLLAACVVLGLICGGLVWIEPANLNPVANEWNLLHASASYALSKGNFVLYLTEGGMIGLCSYIMLHGYVLYRLVKLYQAEQSLKRSVNTVSYGMIGILILIGLQLAGIFNNNMAQVSVVREYWLLMGLLLAGGKLKLLEAGKVE